MEQNRLDIVRNLNLSKFLSAHPWQACRLEQNTRNKNKTKKTPTFEKFGLGSFGV